MWACYKWVIFYLISHQEYFINDHDNTYFNTHWGYDIGAKDMALDIGEKNELFSICSNFSRLLIDPCRSLISETLIRKYVEKDIELIINTFSILNLKKKIVIEKRGLKNIIWITIEF